MEEILKFLTEIKTGQLTLTPGTPYGIKQLEAFIMSGVQISEIYTMGVPYTYHDTLDKFNSLFNEEKSDWEQTMKDAETWEGKIKVNTTLGKRISFYQRAKQYYSTFVHKWDGNRDYYFPEHISSAKREIYRIEGLISEIIETFYQQLTDDMKKQPQVYLPNIMRQLLEGASDTQIERLEADRENWQHSDKKILNEFLVSGYTIDIERLKSHNIIPQSFTKKNLVDPDFGIEQPRLSNLGEYPLGRTDIFFLGVPRSGKSSALAGILYAIHQQADAEYKPQLVNGIDMTLKYKNGLEGSIVNKKCPVATDQDAICFLKMNMRITYTNIFGIQKKKKVPVNFVEMAGESVERIGEGVGDLANMKIWKTRGASTCLESANNKVLFIIIDYAVTQDLSYNWENGSSDRQARLLNDIISHFMNNGTGSENRHNCTMSNVQTVAFIMTKCDLMENANTWTQRRNIAEEYILQKFRSVIELLDDAHDSFNVNVRDSKGHLNILPFSLGKFYIGNTYDYDINDSNTVINFLRETLSC